MNNEFISPELLSKVHDRQACLREETVKRHVDAQRRREAATERHKAREDIVDAARVLGPLATKNVGIYDILIQETSRKRFLKSPLVVRRTLTEGWTIASKLHTEAEQITYSNCSQSAYSTAISLLLASDGRLLLYTAERTERLRVGSPNGEVMANSVHEAVNAKPDYIPTNLYHQIDFHDLEQGLINFAAFHNLLEQK